jgi:hypothetical protein
VSVLCIYAESMTLLYDNNFLTVSFFSLMDRCAALLHITIDQVHGPFVLSLSTCFVAFSVRSVTSMLYVCMAAMSRNFTWSSCVETVRSCLNMLLMLDVMLASTVVMQSTRSGSVSWVNHSLTEGMDASLVAAAAARLGPLPMLARPAADYPPPKFAAARLPAGPLPWKVASAMSLAPLL